MGLSGIGRYALFAAAALLLVALGYRLAPRGEAAGATAAPAPTASATPTDAAGWKSAGETAFAAARYPDAVTAYTRATALAPSDAWSWSALGEAHVQVERGVGPQALAAFRRAVKLDPKDARARYFLAVKRDLDGDHKGAIADWTALLRDAPPGAPWVASVRELVQQVAARERLPVQLPPAPPPAMAGAAMPGAPLGASSAGSLPPPSGATDAIPGPNATQLQGAQRMSPSEQDGMARAMVDRLAARLAESPRDATGWMRLMRSKLVLGDRAGAQKAYATAKTTFRGDAATLAQLDGAAKALGL